MHRITARINLAADSTAKSKAKNLLCCKRASSWLFLILFYMSQWLKGFFPLIAVLLKCTLQSQQQGWVGEKLCLAKCQLSSREEASGLGFSCLLLVYSPSDSWLFPSMYSPPGVPAVSRGLLLQIFSKIRRDRLLREENIWLQSACG